MALHSTDDFGAPQLKIGRASCLRVGACLDDCRRERECFRVAACAAAAAAAVCAQVGDLHSGLISLHFLPSLRFPSSRS